MKSTMMDAPLTVASLLRHGRRWHSDRQVITWSGSGEPRRSTFADVAARAARLAHGLASLGITGDQRVGTYQWNNQEHLEAYLAVPAMGAVLHTANIRLFADQLTYTINGAKDQVMIVDESLAAQFAPLLPDLPTVHTVVVNGTVDHVLFEGSGRRVVAYDDLVADRPDTYAWADVDERDAATICYTTGTTGNPKGVAYSHRSILIHSLSSCTQNALRIGFEDRMLICVPMFHANAWGYPFTAWWHGADMVLLDRFLKPDTIASAVEQERITFANGVPTVWNDVLQLVRREPGRDLSSLRIVVVGGAAVTPSLLESFDREAGARIVQGYGMTETSPLVSVAVPPRGAAPHEELSARLSQGRVAAGVDVRLVEPDTLEDLPADGHTVGEILLRGPWISGSYLGDEGPDKFHEGWLRTGDLGTLDPQGYLRLTDRAKDVIKSGGEWISSVELEGVLLGHPEIAAVTVIGIPDQRWDERPCAVVVPHEGARPDIESLRTWLAGKVARWWIPEYWAFLDALPLTSVGKIDKKELRSRHQLGRLAVARQASALPPSADG
ncbi:long-chain fatty acid--CoA ligase [Amycolatopsis sp. La24]|uniref:long-chain fatty acid--CoA ligase n=1 Tax=Amycolatopsis sp. La24 TaxID=3028304 RepID=UPI0023B058E1|nr:long-chain fatty acid--CoA ligase [Amycolatopsis sp. La24]